MRFLQNKEKKGSKNKLMSKFLKVQCDCGSESVVFGDSKSKVTCFNCKKELLSPRGGKAQVNCKILEIL